MTFFAKSAAGGSWIALFNFEGPLGTQKGGLTQAQTSYGGVAQLGEHLPCKQGVDSSILFVSTTARRRAKSRCGLNEREDGNRARKSVRSRSRFGRMAQRTATDMGS